MPAANTMLPPSGSDLVQVLGLHFAGHGVIHADVALVANVRTFCELGGQDEQRDVGGDDPFCRVLAGVAIQRLHDDGVNLAGEEVLNLVEFASDVFLGVGDVELDALFIGRLLHGVRHVGQVRVLQVKDHNADVVGLACRRAVACIAAAGTPGQGEGTCGQHGDRRGELTSHSHGCSFQWFCLCVRRFVVCLLVVPGSVRLPAVQQYGEHQDDALDSLLEVGGDAQQVHAVHHDAQQEHADDGSPDGADTAEEACPADDDGGNHLKLVAGAGHGRCTIETGSQDEAAQCGGDAADEVDGEKYPACGDAHFFGGFFVSAHGVDVRTELGAAQHELTEQCGQEEDDHRHRDRANEARSRAIQPGHSARRQPARP